MSQKGKFPRHYAYYERRKEWSLHGKLSIQEIRIAHPDMSGKPYTSTSWKNAVEALFNAIEKEYKQSLPGLKLSTSNKEGKSRQMGVPK